MYCPHCDYTTDDEDETECPRCAIRLCPPYLADGTTWRRPRKRFSFSRLRDPAERGEMWHALLAFSRLDLLRLGIVLVSALLLVIGTLCPLIGIGTLGQYNLLHLGDLLALLSKVARFSGSGVLMAPLLGKLAVTAAIVGAVSALLRWRTGISVATGIALIIAMVIVGNYYNLISQAGPDVQHQLAVALGQKGSDIIHPHVAAVWSLVIAALLLLLADLPLLDQQLNSRKWTRRYSA